MHNLLQSNFGSLIFASCHPTDYHQAAPFILFYLLIDLTTNLSVNMRTKGTIVDEGERNDWWVLKRGTNFFINMIAFDCKPFDYANNANDLI
jgi:hypothetical protein